MAIRGDKFLKLSKAGFFSIKEHALERMEEFLGAMPDLDDAFEMFCGSIQLSFSEMWMRGYRPAYKQRKEAGIPTWYFELPCNEVELIAVISKGMMCGEYEWVTTYTRNHRNESNILWGIDLSFQAA
ncbi:MAG: hypothetical protein JXR73_09375 [Candidatus Omnitrophica bacterium]|nr:hypothetical protein [Candidatus Omnitrophota bacterium]